MELSDRTLEELDNYFTAELSEMKHNHLKESLLLLNRKEIECILSISTELGCSSLTKHCSITIYAHFMREYHLKQKNIQKFV